MQKIFDVHAHYDDEAFDSDRYELLDTMLNSGEIVGIVNGATDIETTLFGISTAEKYAGFYTSAGYHPENAESAPKDFIDRIAELLQHQKAVAIGEIGLDYYWKNVPKQIQLEVFEKQLALSKELDLPVVVHDRDAHGDTYELLRKYRPMGIVHCFSGSVELSREVVRLGMSISIGGVVTFKNARHSVDVVREIPLDRLMLETDAPYLTPVPYRGKRCDSRMIKFTAEKIAEIRGITIDKLLTQNIENACLTYGISI
ncbi:MULTISPECIES: TatD family hydrolase [unclassified Ruminococcus]|uniref:TatD family hydrolase n=1 Tax=unclassified Ruminococcus TaxID=2608920 RepID=UPI00210CF790|nr:MULTISPECIES: TatD family hydrolase [unclassified Ruminococcus]